MNSTTLQRWATRFAAGLVAAAAAWPAAATGILVPAYFYPSWNPALSQWDEMTAAAATGVPVTAIVNVNNGPGDASNSDYAAAIAAFRAAGGQVLGYVYTCYGRNLCASGLPGTRSADDVLADVGRWAQWYPMDGVFLDEMSNQLGDLGFYATLASTLRAQHPGWQIVGNPGTATPVDYLDVADTLVTYEGPGDYTGRTTEPWMRTAAPSRQAHLHYNVGDEAAMRALLAEAVSRDAGWVYLTDDRYTPGNPQEPNPWDRLPSWWMAEVAAVQALNDVPEPASAALVAAALAMGLWSRRRRAAAG